MSPPTVEDGDLRPAAGNHLAIEGETDVVFLAHVREGSIEVDIGEK